MMLQKSYAGDVFHPIIISLRNVNEQKDPLPLPEGRCDLC